MVRKKRLPPKGGKRFSISVSVREHYFEILKVGAEYYGITPGVYTQWLLEQALTEELNHYSWGLFNPKPKRVRKRDLVQHITEKEAVKNLIQSFTQYSDQIRNHRATLAEG